MLDVIVDQRETFHGQILAANVTQSNPAIAQYLHSGGSVAALSGLVNLQSAIISYQDATIFIAFIAFIFTPLVFLMRKPKGPTGPVEIGH